MNRRLTRSLVLVAALLVTACSDDGGEPGDNTEPPDTGPASTEQANTGTDTGPDSPGTTAGGTSAGSQAPDSAASGAEVSDIDAGLLAGAGPETIINDFFYFDRDRIAVGYVQELQTGEYQPFMLGSSKGERWERVTAPMPRGADDAMMSAAVRFDGKVFVVGTQWRGERANGVVWAQTDNGWEPNELVGDIADTDSQIVRDAAAGPDGMVALGTSERQETIWTSTDGITWSKPAIEGQPRDLELIDVAANRHGMLVLATANGRPTVLHSPNGTEFRVLNTGNRRQRWNVVTATNDQFVIGGAIYRGDEYAPRLWRLRGVEWPDGPERGHRDRSHYAWGADAEVDAMTHDRGRLLFTVDGVLISSSRRDVWRQLARPQRGRPDDITALVPVPGTESDHAEAAVGGDALYLAGSEEWKESTPDTMESPLQRIELVGVAHKGGTWVAAGTTTDGTGRTSVSIWFSGNGTDWRETHPLRPDRNTSAVTIGTSTNGFVVTGQDPRNDRSLIWTSGNGRTWSRVRTPELRWPKRNGRLNPASIIETPEGFAVGGSRQRRGENEPWLIRVLDDVTPDESPQIHRPDGESAVLGICRPRGNIYMVGMWLDPGTTPAWWSQQGRAPWQRHPLDGGGELRECIATVEDVYALGTVDQQEAVVDISRSQPDVLPLPESDSTLATDLVFVGGRDNRRILVGGHTVEGADDGRLWISDSGDPASWTLIDAPQLGGPGAQRVAGVAGTRNRIIVAINDGSGARLAGVRLRD